jgi:hypothetical protein
MRKFSNDYEVVVITEENIADFVAFPTHIWNKYKAGIIPVAQFTDLLRTLLLINYGGVWLDATVFLTHKIPLTILHANFFVFQTSLLHEDLQPCSNWFIAAKKNNIILEKIFSILSTYWQTNNYLRHYFVFHLTVMLVITHDDEACRQWKKIFYKNNSDPHYLQKKLFDEFDAAMCDYIWNFSFAHKLTYKFSDASLPDCQNTFYQHIIASMENQ